MDTWLKMLIASACVVVIGGGGYLASVEYDAKYSLEAKTKAAIESHRQTMRQFDRTFGSN
ncbi:hypothetical protein ABIA16_003786 [Sinorhizobium fredii]